MVKKPAANPSESPDTVPPGTLTCSMPRVFLRRDSPLCGDFPDTRSSMSEIDGLALPEVYVYVCMYVCICVNRRYLVILLLLILRC